MDFITKLFSILNNTATVVDVSSRNVAIDSVLGGESDAMKHLSKHKISAERANFLLEEDGIKYQFEIPDK